MTKIKHIVYLMLENRSMDQVLGWLYDKANPPKINIPSQEFPSYEGLNASFSTWIQMAISNLLFRGQIII